tara:strand:+ start:1326 stop:1916 length:591 start_codon:yes stop_codon:yes gene_type:complete
MVRNRQGLAPWSLSREAGIESATVDGTIEVPQTCQPVLDTGFVDEKGNWKGIKSSDEQFIAFGVDEAIANGATILAPQIASGTIWPLDMTGFTNIVIAIKPTNGGNVSITAVMGPNDLAYANLKPVNPAAPLKGVVDPREETLELLMNDSSESLTADVWNIFMVQDRLANQKLLQFSIVNNSGGSSDIETAFMRMV